MKMKTVMITKGVGYFARACISRLWVSALEHVPCYGYGVVDVDARWQNTERREDLS